VIFACASNSVFGIHETRLAAGIDADTRPDLDHDGIPDPIDPCIASMADASADYDHDMIPNGMDPCPVDGTSADSDGDGIPDICDPFPATSGDRHRCSYAFQNPDLDTAFWLPRAGEPGWTTTTPTQLVSPGGAVATILAAETIEAPGPTTFDLLAGTYGASSLTLWVRANDPATSDDLGCLFDGTATPAVLSIVRGTTAIASQPAPGSVTGIVGIRMRVWLEPTASGNTIGCYVDFQGLATTVVARAAVAPGQAGFTASGDVIFLDLLSVYDRDDPQPLP
jgi:hypothetical protein